MFPRKAQRVVDRLDGHFELQYQEVRAFQNRGRRIHVGGRQPVVGAFDHPDPILTGTLHENRRHPAGDSGSHQHAAGIDAARREVLDIRRPEEVVAHPGHHGHLRAAQTCCHRLVGALAAEAQAELTPENGLARTREPVGVRDQIDIYAADRRDPRLMFHSNASLPPRYNPLMTSMTIRWVLCATLLCVAAPVSAQTNAELKEQVRQTEIAFAKTMADRDPAAFASFLAGETVFMSGGRATRGSQQVAERWKAFFQGPQAPFSWAPEFVEVLDSGKLAMSSGPVRDPSGKRTGTFNSVWRREADGKWKIVLDNGCPACNCDSPGK